jgi:hypothetical protein
MQVKVSKVLTKELNKRFKERDGFKGYNAVCQSGMDFWGIEKKVITIYYPANYYAFPRDLDDNDLLRVYKDSDKTFDGFFGSLLDFVEI